MLIKNVFISQQTLIFIILFVTSTIDLSQSEFFTALSDMNELEKVEEVLLTNLKSYVNTLEVKINLLKRYFNFVINADVNDIPRDILNNINFRAKLDFCF